MIEVLRLTRLTADDQRRSRLVNEDVVHLVHDREGVPTLHPRLKLSDHVVAQVVEAELVIRAVGDVRGVRLTTGDWAKACGALLAAMEIGIKDVRRVMGDDAEREAEEGEERTHPLRVASREVVVDCDHVDASAGERIDGGGERADKRLPFTSAHLRNLPLMQNDRTQDLHVVWAQLDRSSGRFASRSENFWKRFVERGALRVAAQRAKLRSDRIHSCTDIFGARRLHLICARVDGGEDWREATDLSVVGVNKTREKAEDHLRPLAPEAGAVPQHQDAKCERAENEPIEHARRTTRWVHLWVLQWCRVPSRAAK